MYKVFSVMRKKEYLAIAVVSCLAFALFYAYSQVLFVTHNIGLWIEDIPRLNLLMFMILSVLFGITLSFQIYNLRQPKVCSVKKSIGSSSAATLTSLVVAQCPGCASLGALFIPSTVFLAIFVKYAPIINLINIGLLVFSINYLGGFQRVNA